MSEPERLFSARRAHRNDLYNNWPSHWPRIANHVIQHDVTIEQYQRFVDLLDAKASERELENFFSGNREVLSLTISTFSTGHHMSWIFPKEQVRPPSGKIGGLIPDYLLAGASSGGVEWFVLELKGADKKAFSSHGNRILLSNETNSCQLLNYIDFCSRDQAYLRDGLELKGFRRTARHLTHRNRRRNTR
jgi:hypothetical protein